MSDSTDITDFVQRLEQWLDDPQGHLDDQTRRRLLETVVTKYVIDGEREKERAENAAKRRLAARDIILGISLITALLGFGPNIVEIVKGYF